MVNVGKPPAVYINKLQSNTIVYHLPFTVLCIGDGSSPKWEQHKAIKMINSSLLCIKG